MGQPAFSLSVNFISETCIECGLPFAAPGGFFDERRKNHKGFYCPNGHSQYYSGESDAEKNARLLREEQARHARTIARANESEAREQKVLRKLKRVGRGTCPECNRTFQNLARHMNCKHAEAAK